MRSVLASLKEHAKASYDAQYGGEIDICFEQIANITGDPDDFILHARVLSTSGEYARALHMLEREDLVAHNVESLALSVKCAMACQQFDKALSMLNEDNLAKFAQAPKFMFAKLHVLRAVIYELQENIQLATESYLHALSIDASCVESFQHIIKHHLVSLPILYDKMNHLKFDSPELANFYRNFYGSHMNVGDSVPTSIIYLSKYVNIATNMHLLSCAMSYFYEQAQYRTALTITKYILQRDIMHKEAILHFVAISYELRHHSALYSLAQSIIKSHPGESISWYAVAVYYLLLNRIEECRKALKKATTLSTFPHDCPHAWLLLGHSFSMTEEHESAIQAYNTCLGLFPASREVIQSLAVAHMSLGNINDAHAFVVMSGYPLDLWSLNERGVLLFSDKKYKEALNDFMEIIQAYAKDPISSVQSRSPQQQRRRQRHTENTSSIISLPLHLEEAAYRNAGHCLRKLARYAEAKSCYLKAMELMKMMKSTEETSDFVKFIMTEIKAAPDYHETMALNIANEQDGSDMDKYHPFIAQLYTSLGFVAYQMMQCQEAVDYFHQALMLNSEDVLANQMLRIVMETIFRAPLETTWMHTNMHLKKQSPLVGMEDLLGIVDSSSSYLHRGSTSLKGKEEEITSIIDEEDSDEMIMD